MILFLDNYRGFSNTLVPFQDVTFLVGENSTGKTSILELIKILSGHELFFFDQFSSEALANFTDIVSRDSKNSEFFTIGAVNKSPMGMLGFAVTFKNNAGTPVATQACYYRSGRLVFLKRNKKGVVEYLIKKLHELSSEIALSKKIFNRYWRNIDWDSVNLPLEVVRRSPQGLLFAANLLVADEVEPESAFFMPSVLYPDPVWIAPIRSKPQRTYDAHATPYSPEGAHTPYQIKKSLSKRQNRFAKYINTFGKASGLYEAVRVHQFMDDSDQGPFELEIILNGKTRNINSVGYGVSQSLPVITEVFLHDKLSHFLIQQPEVHLHPRAQSALGDLIFDAARFEEKKLIIETHSDYILDRFRSNYRFLKNRKVTSTVLFFTRSKFGNRVTEIQIKPNGEYSSTQPRAFRNFFIQEQLRILRMS